MKKYSTSVKLQSQNKFFNQETKNKSVRERSMSSTSLKLRTKASQKITMKKVRRQAPNWQKDIPKTQYQQEITN